MRKFSIVFILVVMLFTTCGCNDLPEELPQKEPENVTYYHGELLVLNRETNYLEIRNCPATSLRNDATVEKMVSGELQKISINDLFLGMTNLYAKVVDNHITRLIVDGDAGYRNIRVAIRKSINDIANSSTIYHDQVKLYSVGDVSVSEFDAISSNSIRKESLIIIEIIDGEMQVSCNNEVILTSKKRLIFTSTDLIRIPSISRAQGVPEYQGAIELTIVDGRILVTNDVEVEEYLRRVVPSEMPASWNSEALKAQAVAARTYAINDIINGRNAQYGYSVDDSVSSQVYNNINVQNGSDQAVLATKGITMYNGGKPIIAYYYSGTCGLTSNGNEVWIEDDVIEEIPYLIGQNLTDQIVNTASETAMLAFFKKIAISSPAGASSNHRWHIAMTKEQLRNTLNVNMQNMYKKDTRNIETLVNNEYVNKPITPDIGIINNIFVAKRGTSGIVIHLVIETSTGTYRINNQYNIRFTIRPKDAGSTVVSEYGNNTRDTYQSTRMNDSILPSGFFALEWTGDTIHFYGGGSGHGVGMCQYSANYYGKSGLDYQTILSTFYANLTFVNVANKYEARTDIAEMFA